MKKPKARDRILETAGLLFQARGISEVGVNEIIEKAATAKATFYQHFPSKDALCEAWLKAIHDRSEKQRRELLASPADPAEKIDQYFGGIAQFMKDSDFRGCPYSNTSAVVGKACRGIRGQIESHKDSVRKFLRELALQLTGHQERSCEVGDSLFVLYSGGTTESQNLRALWPAEVARRTAREICAAEKKDAGKIF